MPNPLETRPKSCYVVGIDGENMSELNWKKAHVHLFSSTWPVLCCCSIVFTWATYRALSPMWAPTASRTCFLFTGEYLCIFRGSHSLKMFFFSRYVLCNTQVLSRVCSGAQGRGGVIWCHHRGQTPSVGRARIEPKLQTNLMPRSRKDGTVTAHEHSARDHLLPSLLLFLLPTPRNGTVGEYCYRNRLKT